MVISFRNSKEDLCNITPNCGLENCFINQISQKGYVFDILSLYFSFPDLRNPYRLKIYWKCVKITNVIIKNNHL